MLAAVARRRLSLGLRRLFVTAAADSAAHHPPPPIRVMHTPFAGRGVFATRDIATGEVLHSARPLVTHPSASQLGKVCYNCLRRLEDVGLFCGEKCREYAQVFYEVEKSVNWRLFDDYCRLRGLKYPFMVKRLACMVVSGVMAAGTLDILQLANLSEAKLVEMEEEYKFLQRCFQESPINDELFAFLDGKWYINVLARIHINSFRIELIGREYEDLFADAASLLSTDTSVGNAVYMVPSFYNHDCDPNAHILWLDNADAKLKSLRDIEAGEEMRICYVDCSMDCAARQKILLEGFGFQCCCSRCLSGD